MVCARRLQLPALAVAIAIVIALALAGSSASGSSESEPQPRPPIISSLDIAVPAPPAVVRIAGTRYLVYELHLTNLRTSDVTLQRVEILDAGRSRDTPLADLREEKLDALLGRPGAPFDRTSKRIVAAGMRAIVYLWLPLDQATGTPASVRHHIELEVTRASERQQMIVDTGATAVRIEAPLVLSPPLRGGPWVALYDPLLIGGHRTSIYAIGGRPRIPARFAIDWVRLDADGTHAHGDASQIANWHGYGADVLAVADAVVAEAHDDIAEAPSLMRTSQTPIPIPLENVSGNFVCLDLGAGRYAFYEHLAHGSITVKPGDRVKTGDVIGRLGNSGGSSSGPHLHFHVADAAAELASEGVPYVFKRFNVIGAFDTIDAFTAGRPWNAAPANAAGTRDNELPAPNTVIRFDATGR